jgi:hypothetical protein
MFFMLLFVLLVVVTCGLALTQYNPETAAPFRRPTATAVKIFPTPSSPGDAATWRDLRVTMDDLEITTEFVTDYNSVRTPPDGMQFLWIHVTVENLGRNEMNLPLLENFSVLYAALEIKPVYGYRKEYPEYASLTPIIFPAQSLGGWLRFDIPAAAQSRDLRFVFLPESASVGTSYSSPNYPYAADKPTFVWNCAP